MTVDRKRLDSINAMLKGSGVAIECRKDRNRLALVSVLPPKNGVGKAIQQRISLGLGATLFELEIAQARAHELIAQKIRGDFAWEKWADGTGNCTSNGDCPQIESIGEMLEKYKQHRKLQGIKDERLTREWEHLKLLPLDKKPEMQFFLNIISRTAPNSSGRKESFEALQRLISFAGWSIDITPYRSNYSASKVKPRNLPSDVEIEQMRLSMGSDLKIASRALERWRYVVGVMAAYGLRPHEIFFAEINDRPPYPCVVLKGKTGKRTVFPFHPHWVEEWQLSNANLPEINLDRPYRTIGQCVTDSLRRYGIYNPYDLRHAYSIRGHVQYKNPDRVMAGLLGHSVGVWQRTYSRWLRDDDLLKAYLRSLDNVQHVPTTSSDGRWDTQA